MKKMNFNEFFVEYSIYMTFVAVFITFMIIVSMNFYLKVHQV